MRAKKYQNWLAVEKVIAKISRLTFWPTMYINTCFELIIHEGTIGIHENSMKALPIVSAL